MFPGLMDLEDLKNCPPTVLFTSEFDFLRRDVYHFIDRLKSVGKYLDHQDMPGVHHDYQSLGNIKQTYWYHADMAKAIDKYVK